MEKSYFNRDQFFFESQMILFHNYRNIFSLLDRLFYREQDTYPLYLTGDCLRLSGMFPAKHAGPGFCWYSGGTIFRDTTGFQPEDSRYLL